jgi:hypothetical protein
MVDLPIKNGGFTDLPIKNGGSTDLPIKNGGFSICYSTRGYLTLR